MKPIVTRIGVILALCSGGLAVSQALSLERWVVPVQVAGEAVLAQERRSATSPVRRSRFARPVPRGWAAPSLVGARGRPDETWRPGLVQLGLPVAAQAPRLGVEPAGVMGLSMERDAGAPLPQVRLVADVLDAMPDKCDERLFGTWYCSISCLYDDCEADGPTYILSRSIDPDGYERIHHRYINGDDLRFFSEWRVERKWGAFTANSPLEKGKLLYASCNGRTDAGHSRLAVNLKNPDGSDRQAILYWVDGANRAMWVEYYNVWREGDKTQKKRRHREQCRREIKRYE